MLGFFLYIYRKKLSKCEIWSRYNVRKGLHGVCNRLLYTQSIIKSAKPQERKKCATDIFMFKVSHQVNHQKCKTYGRKNCTKYKTYKWHSRPTGSPDSLHGAWTIQKIIKAKYFLSSKYESAINVKHWQRQNVTSYHFFRYLNFFVFQQKKTLSFY